MNHDFDPLTQCCRACRLPRVVVEDEPKFAACSGSERTRDMYGLTIAQLYRMRSMVQPEEAAEIEKMSQPFRMYAQLIGRDAVEKIAADVLNGAMEDAVSREQWAQALDETLPAPPLPDRGFGV